MYVAKTKALIKVVTAQLICSFGFACAKGRFSHDAAHIYCVAKDLAYLLAFHD